MNNQEQANYELMLTLTRQENERIYTKHDRDNALFLPVAYNKAYWQGRQ